MRTINPRIQAPSKSYIALFIIISYAVAITPLAYQEARRQVILWASQQPDIPIGGGYTKADRDDLANAISSTPAGIPLTEKEKSGK